MEARGIPTLVVDPRRTGTVQGYVGINAENSFHFSTINGDIAIQNALAHVLLADHPEACDMEFLRGNRAIRDHVKGGKSLLLFEKLGRLFGINR